MLNIATIHAPCALRTPAVPRVPNQSDRAEAACKAVQSLVGNIVQVSIDAEAHNRDQSDFYGTGKRMRYVTDKQADLLRRAGFWQEAWRGVVTVQAASALVGAVIERDRAIKAADEARYEEDRQNAWHDYEAEEAMHEGYFAA